MKRRKMVKRGPRGPYKKKTAETVKMKKVKLTFPNLNPTRAKMPGIKVAGTCISMDADTAKEMGLSNGNYIIIGKNGKEAYLTAKPKNVAAGYKLRASKTGRLTANIRTKPYNLIRGVYQPGEPVLSDIPTEQGDFAEVVAYPLINQ